MKKFITLVSGCLLASMLFSCKHEVKKEVQPTRVETMTINSTAISSGMSYSGVIEESKGTMLSFKVPGTIMNLNVTEGQKVAKGQLIATLSDASLQSNLEIAKAALATTQDTYNRIKQLHDAKSITDMRWVEVENSLKAAQSSYDIARNALEDTKLYAPFSGIISQKFADAGSNTAPAMPVVKLVEISPVKASISVAEGDIAKFTPGTKAQITIDAADALTIEGTMAERGVAADPLSRTYNVKFLADNSDARLLPGMLCTVSVEQPEPSQAVVIPVDAVLLDSSNRSFVWLAKDGKAVKRIITLGAYTTGGVIARSGLAAGDSLIVGGQQKISEGMEVEPVNR